MADPSLLAGLNEEQRQAALALVGPVRIIAGAGTGKTRTITHRIAHGVREGVYDPSRVLALTFTAKAAGELRARLSALGVPSVPAKTFHAAALGQLGYFWPHVVGGVAPKLLSGKSAVISEAAARVGLRVDPAAVRDLATEIEARKVRERSIAQAVEEAASSGRQLPGGLVPDALGGLLQAYEDVKDERRAMDFEDVLLATAGMLELEPWVTQRVREQYRFFVVDEYQDVSPLQHRLLRLWLGDRRELCVVGDPAQTIFSFTGATSAYLTGFEREFAGARTIELETNYRSRAAIIDVANGVAREIPHALVLQPAGRETGPAAVVEGYGSTEDEAAGLAAAVGAELASGTHPSDIAVLYRLRGQSVDVERAFDAARIPYLVQGQRRFFEVPEVRKTLLALRAGLLEARREPLFQTVSRIVSELGWRSRPPTSTGAERETWAALDALVRLADAAGPDATLAGFVADLESRQRLQLEPRIAAVTLSTIHAAKGLEWASVHVIGAAEGLLPFGDGRDERQVAEERRLFYVAVTRARERLRVSHGVASDRPGRERAASRFLAALDSRTPRAAATPTA